MKRRVNQAGIDLIKQYEGLRLVCYLCSAGVPTIGYGSTRGLTKADVGVFKITEAQAEERLEADVEKAADAVERLITAQINDNQFAALVSFTFNLGSGALAKITLRMKINDGHIESAPVEFARWNRARGKVSRGLVRRRAAEAELFQRRTP